MCERVFDKAALDGLRADVQSLLSPYRFAHTTGVEDMAATLAKLYCPACEGLLRAAALLHDITKEYDDEAQLAVFKRHGVVLRPDEAASPKIWHGMTAALEIPFRYPLFADPMLIGAVRWHTTGRADMTLPEALLYLADYIEPGRKFADCVVLRDMFFFADPAAMNKEARLLHLVSVLIRSLEMTMADLHEAGAPICPDTEDALLFLKKNENPLLKG